MNFEFTEEQAALESTLQRFLERDYTFEQRQALIKSEEGFSREHWNTFAELGLLALPFAEQYGGLDGSAVDTYVVMRSVGKGLIVEPYLSTILLCGQLVQTLGTDAQKEALIGSLAGGEQLLALAHYEPQGRHNEAIVSCRATKTPDGWQIDGHKSVVLGAPSADTILVSARHDGDADSEAGVSVFMVPRNTPGLELKPWINHDGSRAADVVLEGVAVTSADCLGEPGAALPAIRQALAIANVALAAEASGIMRALLHATVEYLNTRKQFGVALSSFQALQHRLADMAIATEQAESMALLAAITMQNENPAKRIHQASGAKAFVSEKARLVAQEAVQLHGGIGVMDELDVAHYFKRITTINMLFGDSDYHLRRYTEMLEVHDE